MEKFSCPGCAMQIPLEPGDRGRLMQCPDCGREFRVGGPLAAPAVAPAAVPVPAAPEAAPIADAPEPWYERNIALWVGFGVGTAAATLSYLGAALTGPEGVVRFVLPLGPFVVNELLLLGLVALVRLGVDTARDIRRLRR